MVVACCASGPGRCSCSTAPAPNPSSSRPASRRRPRPRGRPTARGSRSSRSRPGASSWWTSPAPRRPRRSSSCPAPARVVAGRLAHRVLRGGRRQHRHLLGVERRHRRDPAHRRFRGPDYSPRWSPDGERDRVRLRARRRPGHRGDGGRRQRADRRERRPGRRRRAGVVAGRRLDRVRRLPARRRPVHDRAGRRRVLRGARGREPQGGREPEPRLGRRPRVVARWPLDRVHAPEPITRRSPSCVRTGTTSGACAGWTASRTIAAPRGAPARPQPAASSTSTTCGASRYADARARRESATAWTIAPPPSASARPRPVRCASARASAARVCHRSSGDPSSSAISTADRSSGRRILAEPLRVERLTERLQRDRLVLRPSTGRAPLDRAPRPRHRVLEPAGVELELPARSRRAAPNEPVLPRLAAERIVLRARPQPLRRRRTRPGAAPRRSGRHGRSSTAC